MFKLNWNKNRFNQKKNEITYERKYALKIKKFFGFCLRNRNSSKYYMFRQETRETNWKIVLLLAVGCTNVWNFSKRFLFHLLLSLYLFFYSLWHMISFCLIAIQLPACSNIILSLTSTCFLFLCVVLMLLIVSFFLEIFKWTKKKIITNNRQKM